MCKGAHLVFYYLQGHTAGQQLLLESSLPCLQSLQETVGSPTNESNHDPLHKSTTLKQLRAETYN